MMDHLPVPYNTQVESLFQYAYAAAWSDGLPDYLIYPRDALMELRESHSVFRKLDTHMTDIASHHVANHLLRRLGLDYSLESYFSSRSTPMSGDLAAMMKSADKSTEIRFVQKHLPTKVFDNYSSLPGNSNNICFMHNRFALSERRLLVMGDSFIRSGLTYFSQAFRDIAYVRSAQFQGDMVDLFCPDVIISSNAERYLSRVGADADSTSVLLSGYGVPSYKPSDHFTDAYKAQLSYRHHRKVYALWSHKLAGNALRFWALGEGIPNRQINVVDPLARSFESWDQIRI